MSSRAACRLEALGYHRIFDYVDGIADWKAAGLATEGTANPEQRVIDAMRSDVPTCQPDDAIGEVRSNVIDSGWDICVVLDCDGMAIGRIRGEGFVDGDHFVVDVMETGPSTVRPDQPLQPLLQRMHQANAPNVIVTTPQGELLGILLKDEANRLLAGEPAERIWADCDCCPGRWTTKVPSHSQRDSRSMKDSASHGLPPDD